METLSRICSDVAHTIHNGRKPSDEYAERVACLLKGTVAHESAGGQYRRQIGFTWGELRGAWGVAQLEAGSVGDSLKYIDNRPALEQSIKEYLAGNPIGCTLDLLYEMMPLELMQTIAINDRLAIIFCRLHYMRFPAPVPPTLDGQADYWKKYYNTHLGSGTPEQYKAHYAKYVS